MAHEMKYRLSSCRNWAVGGESVFWALSREEWQDGDFCDVDSNREKDKSLTAMAPALRATAGLQVPAHQRCP